MDFSEFVKQRFRQRKGKGARYGRDIQRARSSKFRTDAIFGRIVGCADRHIRALSGRRGR